MCVLGLVCVCLCRYGFYLKAPQIANASFYTPRLNKCRPCCASSFLFTASRCGTTPIYCDGPAPPPSGAIPMPPTPSIDAGKCGAGEEGEGLCADEEDCCSQWGYCGPGALCAATTAIWMDCDLYFVLCSFNLDKGRFYSCFLLVHTFCALLKR